MFVPLRSFSSVEELKPVLDHGGEVVFVPLMVHPGCCVYDGDLPWKIYILCHSSRFGSELGLADQLATLVHEFIHIFHHSSIGYHSDPNETRIFHEKEVIRQTTRLMTRHPQIADDIVRELILNPNCSVTFPPKSKEVLGINPFREYYFGLVAELGKQQLL